MVSVWGVLGNYHTHADEMGSKIEEKPQFFLMPESALAFADSEGNVEVALGRNDHLTEHEVEMVIRIGENLEPIEMAIGCDTTDRTVQRAAKMNGKPWTEAKGFRGAAVVGVWVPYEIGDFNLEFLVNGEIRQTGSTTSQVFDIPTLIAELEARFGLQPDDIIFTGTPAGVNRMESGDRIQASLTDGEGNIISHFDGVCSR